ncbi:unnamed protein product [Linum tenue]|uniref:Uncharacterized protein n=1 Tax=Linum tenue TaxID=586396 RepID=A0AAV0MQQ8_9ROSI|nr:unnamed protein product [Linum tenue]
MVYLLDKYIFSRGFRNPRFLADSVEQTNSSTHMSVHTPATTICVAFHS